MSEDGALVYNGQSFALDTATRGFFEQCTRLPSNADRFMFSGPIDAEIVPILLGRVRESSGPTFEEQEDRNFRRLAVPLGHFQTIGYFSKWRYIVR
jgi:hypothetical protein